MAEFALIAPVFLLLVVGLLVFGRLFFYWIQTNHLANETARWAVVDNNPYDASCPGGPWTGAPGCMSIQQRAKRTATAEFRDKAAVCLEFPDAPVTTPPTPPEVGQRVKVTVTLPVTFAKFFGGGVTIRGTSTMRIENLGDLDNGPTDYAAGCAT